jgi:hypothetical protein
MDTASEGLGGTQEYGPDKNKTRGLFRKTEGFAEHIPGNYLGEHEERHNGDQNKEQFFK